MLYNLLIFCLLCLPFVYFFSSFQKSKRWQKIVAILIPFIFSLYLIFKLPEVRFSLYGLKMNLTFSVMLFLEFASYKILYLERITIIDIAATILNLFCDIGVKFFYTSFSSATFEQLSYIRTDYEFKNLYILFYIIVIFIVYGLLLALKDNKKITKSTTLIIIIIFTFLLSFIFFLQYQLASILSEYNNELIAFIIASFIFFAMILILSFLVIVFYLQKINTDKKKINDEQMDSLNKYYDKVTKISQDELIKLRHDIKNIIQIAKLYDEDISKQLEDKYKKNEFKKRSNDELLDKILAVKYYEAENLGIDFEINIDGINENLNMQKIDEISLFTNIIDNAIEASKESKDKKITLDINYDSNWLDIKITNSADKIISKKDTIFHGKGKYIVANIVNKFNGTIYNKYANNLYSLFIEINILKKEEN